MWAKETQNPKSCSARAACATAFWVLGLIMLGYLVYWAEAKQKQQKTVAIALAHMVCSKINCAGYP